MAEKIPVSVELQAKRPFLAIFEKRMPVQALARLKPLVDRIKEDFAAENYRLTEDFVRMIWGMRKELGFHMLILDRHTLRLDCENETLYIIMHYGRHKSDENFVNTYFHKHDVIDLEMLEALNNVGLLDRWFWKGNPSRGRCNS